MAEPVSLPPGSDNPPDQAPGPFTEEEIEWLAGRLHRAVDGPTCHCPKSVRYEFGAAAVEAFRALAEAGRLLPASGEVTEDRGYRRKHRAGDGYTPTLLAGHRPASWQEGAQEMRRTTRRWRDGSQWTGPWEVVE